MKYWRKRKKYWNIAYFSYWKHFILCSPLSINIKIYVLFTLKLIGWDLLKSICKRIPYWLHIWRQNHQLSWEHNSATLVYELLLTIYGFSKVFWAKFLSSLICQQRALMMFEPPANHQARFLTNQLAWFSANQQAWFSVNQHFWHMSFGHNLANQLLEKQKQIPRLWIAIV